jgi:hypothetical protein
MAKRAAMKSTTTRIRLDWSKLLAFSQIKSTAPHGRVHGIKSPAMTMFGVKVLQADNPLK